MHLHAPDHALLEGRQHVQDGVEPAAPRDRSRQARHARERRMRNGPPPSESPSHLPRCQPEGHGGHGQHLPVPTHLMLSSRTSTRKRGRPCIFQYCRMNCRAFCGDSRAGWHLAEPAKPSMPRSLPVHPGMSRRPGQKSSTYTHTAGHTQATGTTLPSHFVSKRRDTQTKDACFGRVA